MGTHVFSDFEPLVVSAMHGHNVSCIAYGQTGSGKTHTMEFMCAKAFDRIFSDGFEGSVELSMLEVYCDRVFDLLSSTPIDRTSGGCPIRWDKKKSQPRVLGATW